MRNYPFILLLCTVVCSCADNNTHAQKQEKKNTGIEKRVGGACEGCEAIYESKIMLEDLNETDTLPMPGGSGPQLVISGTVYKKDGITPAPDVVIYVYHTDGQGQYHMTGKETGWGKRHGSIRGWMKTNAQGQYKFYTTRPASYSKTGPPAHIHTTIKEPGKNEYWIDDFLFDDDPFLSDEAKENQRGRGGNGILHLQQKDGVYYAERNIVLGKNVENYN